MKQYELIIDTSNIKNIYNLKNLCRGSKLIINFLYGNRTTNFIFSGSVYNLQPMGNWHNYDPVSGTENEIYIYQVLGSPYKASFKTHKYWKSPTFPLSVFVHQKQVMNIVQE